MSMKASERLWPKQSTTDESYSREEETRLPPWNLANLPGWKPLLSTTGQDTKRADQLFQCFAFLLYTNTKKL